MEAFITIDRVSKSFGQVVALHEVAFSIGQGEFFSLLGPSGCGKTTLLRILAGIERPSSGRVGIDGQDVTDVPPNRRPTNMVFQSYAIFPHLTVAENVGYGLRYRGVKGAEARARVDAALAMVKLADLGGRSAHQLSGGQRQRVALARALVLRPKVLLLDEPLSALDRKLREEMQIELRTLQRNVGITFVFVTHDQEEALTLSDRIAVMEGGRILQIDTPQGLYDRPANRTVAGFIGTMNLLPGRVTAFREGTALVDGGRLGPLVGAAADGVAEGAPVVLALRPEAVRRAADGAGAANRVSGRVAAVSYLGDRSMCVIEVEGLEAPFIAVETRGRGVPSEFGVDDRVTLGWDEAAGLVLPA